MGEDTADREPGAHVPWRIQADPALAETLRLSAELYELDVIGYIIKAIDFYTACTPEHDRDGSMIFLQDPEGMPVDDPEVLEQIFRATTWEPTVSSDMSVMIEGMVPRTKAAVFGLEAQARGISMRDMVWKAIIYAAEAQNKKSLGYTIARHSAQGTEVLSFE